ncbi:MAG: RNA-binding protein [Nitrososphaerota archaeon]|jgi:ribosomal RNA assembly protein|nr:RNA-binding protein [Nitrososphaerota archaeon]MDG6919318.1 RNA-binding protein [Nitrososphaerota archaeon]
MSFEQVVRIPVDRVGAVIGKEGATKRYLESEMSVTLQVDGKEGLVLLKSESAVGADPFSATRVIEAIGRGFSPQKACRLLDEGTALEVIDLRGYAGRSAKSLERIRGRVIGLKGKSRRVIEELTSCSLSVYGRTVAIIGESGEVQLASDAVKSLASGSQHKTVYNTLQRARTRKKMERMFLWEGTSPETLEEKLRKIEH